MKKAPHFFASLKTRSTARRSTLLFASLFLRVERDKEPADLSPRPTGTKSQQGNLPQ